jgi:hypothetical protein
MPPQQERRRRRLAPPPRNGGSTPTPGPLRRSAAPRTPVTTSPRLASSPLALQAEKEEPVGCVGCASPLSGGSRRRPSSTGRSGGDSRGQQQGRHPDGSDVGAADGATPHVGGGGGGGGAERLDSDAAQQRRQRRRRQLQLQDADEGGQGLGDNTPANKEKVRQLRRKPGRSSSAARRRAGTRRKGRGRAQGGRGGGGGGGDDDDDDDEERGGGMPSPAASQVVEATEDAEEVRGVEEAREDACSSGSNDSRDGGRGGGGGQHSSPRSPRGYEPRTEGRRGGKPRPADVAVDLGGGGGSGGGRPPEMAANAGLAARWPSKPVHALREARHRHQNMVRHGAGPAWELGGGGGGPSAKLRLDRSRSRRGWLAARRPPPADYHERHSRRRTPGGLAHCCCGVHPEDEAVREAGRCAPAACCAR